MAVTTRGSIQSARRFEAAAPCEVSAPTWLWLNSIAQALVRHIGPFLFYFMWLSRGPGVATLSSEVDDLKAAPGLADFQCFGQ
jgi:hypothetical protein